MGGGQKIIREMNILNYIQSIINCWDPMDLLIHAPSDEYHSEIAEIENLFNSSKDISELAEGIYQVFVRSFGANNFRKSRSECAVIAQRIISAQNQ